MYAAPAGAGHSRAPGAPAPPGMRAPRVVPPPATALAPRAPPPRTTPARLRRRPAAATASAAFRPCIDIHKVGGWVRGVRRGRGPPAPAGRAAALRSAGGARRRPPPRARPSPRPPLQGVVKQIVGSTLADLGGSEAAPVTNFEATLPSSFFASLYSNSNLPGGHVIMLGADDASKAAATAALMTFPGGLQLGGGVNAANAAAWLDAGASHVIVTSAVFREGRLDEAALAGLVQAVGRDRLILDLSCRRREPGGPYYVVTDRWQCFSELEVGAATLGRLGGECAEFLVHAVDVEGKSLGVDIDLISLLGAHSPVPVTYAGGASSLADLDAVAAAGQGRVDVTVGSALDIFGGRLPYADVLAWHRRQRAGG